MGKSALPKISSACVLLLLVPFTGSPRGIVSLTMATILAAGLMLGIAALPVGLYGGGAAAVIFIPSLQLLGKSVFGPAPWLFNLAVGLGLLGLLFQVVIAFHLLGTLLSRTKGADLRRFLPAAGAAVGRTGLLLWSNAGGTHTFLRAVPQCRVGMAPGHCSAECHGEETRRYPEQTPVHYH